MIGIDTNVLVRVIVRDDLDQARKAERFINRNCSSLQPGFINRIVLCELVWVLETSYRYPREKVALALKTVLRSFQFEVEDSGQAWLSLLEYQRGADFADSFISSVNRNFGCESTFTFDQKAARRPGFTLL